MSLRKVLGQDGRAVRDLERYHDGELRRLARRRVERALLEDPALGQELALLREMGELVRECDSQAETPDLWERIAMRLPAEDANRAVAPSERERAASPWRRRSSRWALLTPIGALAAAAVATLVWVRFFATPEVGFAEGGVVRWIDTGGRSVMLLEDNGTTGATLIWLLDNATEGASRGDSHEMV